MPQLVVKFFPPPESTETQWSLFPGRSEFFSPQVVSKINTKEKLFYPRHQWKLIKFVMIIGNHRAKIQFNLFDGSSFLFVGKFIPMLAHWNKVSIVKGFILTRESNFCSWILISHSKTFPNFGKRLRVAPTSKYKNYGWETCW